MYISEFENSRKSHPNSEWSEQSDSCYSSNTPEREYGLMVRFIDDFLYVSTSLTAATSFVDILETGNQSTYTHVTQFHP
jgi:hypothetical protein